MTSRADGPSSARRAVVVGLGLIGGSVALALREQGWHVSGVDVDAEVANTALERDVVTALGDDLDADLIVICTPSASVVEVGRSMLERREEAEVILTDVAGVKARICEELDDPRFIGGHPMAGSEQLGLDGARNDLFIGATWVLAPSSATSPERYATLASIVRSMGARALALAPSDHDRLVALVSHVPHLVAASLMNEATSASRDDAALLQLAAGGFRDMTRVAAGDPGIWPDVCVENASAILEGLDELSRRLDAVRHAVAGHDRAALHDVLDDASKARRALPGRAIDPEHLAQVRIPVPDQPGVIAEVAGAASDLGVSVVDLEIAHSVEGDRGVLIVVVADDAAPRLAADLSERGYRCAVQELGQ